MIDQRCAVALLLALTAACSSEVAESGPDGTWVGTITTEGNVTTVVNESGSVWGGTARLVEEASIGVESGAPEYMLAMITSITASDDHIYVLEMQPPILRVYDFEGEHIRDIGGAGQGPGEFTFPMSVVVIPDGRVLVRDEGNSRYNVYSLDGQSLETWAIPGSFGTSRRTVIVEDGTLYMPYRVITNPQTRETIWSYVALGPEGPTGDPILPPVVDYETPRLAGGGVSVAVPYYPRVFTEFSPVGAYVTGISDRYRLEVHYKDGRTLIIERLADPVPVTPPESSSHERTLTAFMRERDPTWTWRGPRVPDEKPYFDWIYPGQNGRIWVRRPEASSHVAGCDELIPKEAGLSPCWEEPRIFDVFARDGRLLAEVEAPSDFVPGRNVYIRGDLVLDSIQDEAGTIMVKRYRLVLPGER